jgi:hypothetical protein
MFGLPCPIVHLIPSGQLSGTGLVGGRCDSCPQGSLNDTFNFSDGIFGMFITSGSGTASFTDITGRRASLTGQVEQKIDATGSNFSLDALETVSVRAVGSEWGGSATLRDDFNLTFTVTTESTLNLTGVVSESLFGDSFFVFRNFIFNGSLSNPETGFSFPFPDAFGTLDSRLMLDPGTYQLAGSFGGEVPVGPLGDPFLEETFSQELSLQADLTAVPEPSGASIIPVLLAAIIAFLARRRTVVADR